MAELARRAVLVLAILLLPATAAAAESRLRLVASFPILADIARQVGGDLVDVASLLPPGAEPHAWEPQPRELARLAGADMVIVNGLGFEGWLDRAVAASGYRGELLVASRGLMPMRDAAGLPDPHAWHSLDGARHYAAAIAGALSRRAPDHAAAFAVNLGRFEARLDALDAGFRKALAAVPPASRIVVTTHDAFAWLGRDYGIRFLAPQGLDSAAQASARRVAELVDEIRTTGVSAVFVEAGADPRLARMLADEAGVTIGGELYAGTLSRADGPAPDYPAMWAHNTGLMLAAMPR